MDFLQKKIFVHVLVIFTMIFSLLSTTGCGNSSSNIDKITTEKDLDNPKYKIGAPTGSLALEEGKKFFPSAKMIEYKTCADMYMALQFGKIDAIVFDRPPLEYVLTQRDDFMIFPTDIAVIGIAVGAPLDKKELIGKVNEFIKQYKADGTYDEMYKRWVRSTDPVMPDIPKPANPQGTLTIGVECQTMPMNFIDSTGNLSGFDMEFIKRLTLFLNMDYKLLMMDYSALFPACAGGKIDLAVAQLDVTPERMESMLFSENHVYNPVAIMIRKKDYEPASEKAEVVSKP